MAKTSFDWHIHHKGNDAEALEASILSNLEYRLAKDQYSATAYDRFLSTAYAVVERLVERWITTQQTYHKRNVKRVYYLSMEFLLGRSLENSLINLGLYDACAAALKELGMDLETIRNYEVDAGLGNGGLGRLAACFLDSMATLCIPAHGYGLRYEYGLFHQKIVNGRQVEIPDNWLARTNPWEVARPEYTFKVRFGGTVEHKPDVFGRKKTNWIGGEEVIAMAYDTPVPGYMVNNVNTLRLWSSRATEEFNLEDFNTGDYMSACQRKVVCENITKVLYPNDNFFEGKELRLKQEYFLVSASIQDILRRFKAENNDIKLLPERVAIQLNDTHPALAIPELMHLLVDEESMDWDQAWDLTTKTFGYTNHTVLPEALEEWPVSLLERVLPRHMEIIYIINHNFLKDISMRYPGNNEILGRMSMIAEQPEKRVRMAYLATIGSHSVNGVAELHSRLLKQTILKDFCEIWPAKFNNKTNGVTQRRWLLSANPALSAFITSKIGHGWEKDLAKLSKLEKFADDPAVLDEFMRIKHDNKIALAKYLKDTQNIFIDPDSIFDVQIKRLHEYKRQLLNILHVMYLYNRILEDPSCVVVPHTFIFGAKAASGYRRAKSIIKLINTVADRVNNDHRVKGKIRVVFVENYRVSLAEKLFPASDVSEQISTAGKEASGTGNMKFMINGAVTIGTLDGANIEIVEEAGEENAFIFGLTTEQIQKMEAEHTYNPQEYLARNPGLLEVLNQLIDGTYGTAGDSMFRELYESLVYGVEGQRPDVYYVLADFDAYLEAQENLAAAYTDKRKWAKIALLNVARSGKFSSDRTIDDYVRDIWKLKKVVVE